MRLAAFLWCSGLVLLASMLGATRVACQVPPWPTFPWPSLFTQPVYQQLTPPQGAFIVGGAPMMVDVTGDGIDDIITTTRDIYVSPPWTDRLTVYPGLGNGQFGSPVLNPGPFDWNFLAHFDADLDGDTDLVAYRVGSGAEFCVLYNDGGGTFNPGACEPILSATGSLCINAGDVNNDGTPEVVALANDRYDVWTYLGSGWNRVWTSPPLDPLALTCAPGIADVNGDGWADIVAFPWLSSMMSIYLHDAGGGYSFTGTTPVLHGLQSGAWPLLGDLDGDGDTDVVSCAGRWIRCNLAAPYAPLLPVVETIVTAVATSYVNQAGTADFNGDGLLDVFIREDVYYFVAGLRSILGRIHLNRGAGSFEVQPLILDLGITNGSAWVVVHDLDRDGDPDLVIMRDSFNTPTPSTEIGVVWNLSIAGPGAAGTAGIPTLSHGDPAPGNAAFSVSLTGALPRAIAVLGVSNPPALPGSSSSALWLDPATLYLPTPSGLGIVRADAQGSASIPLPIPPSAPQGLGFAAQWAVLDPAGTFTPLPGLALALSPAAHVMIW